MKNQIRISMEDDELEAEVSIMVPSKNQMCDVCEGNGMIDNPAFSNGITQSDREDMGEEDFQSYMDGRYDVRCDCCGGNRVIQVMDVSRMTYEQKRFAVKVRQHDRDQAQYEREYAAECAAERQFGC